MSSLSSSCFICGSSSVVSTNEVKSSRNGGNGNIDSCDWSELSEQEREAYHQQEKVVLGHSVFVIKVLLQVPQTIFMDNGNAALLSEDGVIQRMGFCQGCSDSVQKALAVYREMLEALQSFRRIQLELVEKVGKRKMNTGLEDEIENGVLEKWRKFVKRYEYGSDTDSFLLEDFDSIVDCLAMSLRSASKPKISPSVEIKSEHDDEVDSESEDDLLQRLEDHADDTDSDHYSLLEDPTDDMDTKSTKSLDKFVDNENSEPLPANLNIIEEAELEISEDIRDESKDEDDDWKPSEDPLAESSNEAETSQSSDVSESEEEYQPKRKRIKRQISNRRPPRGPPSSSRRKPTRKAPAVISNQDPTERLKCSQKGCPKSFRTQSGLTKHLRVSHKVKTVPCESCNETFFTIQHLTDHMHKDHPGSTFSCNQCPKYFQNEASPKIHIARIHNPTPTEFYCTEEGCGKTFANKAGLHNHIIIVHKLKPPKGNKHYPCPEEGCGKIYVTPEALRVHISRHKGDPQYKCPTCDTKFFSWQQMKRHEEKVHLSANGVNNAFVCELCGRRFSCTHNLQMHRKKFHGDSKNSASSTPIICELCGKTYLGKTSLHLHQRNVHENKKSSFTCEHCGKTVSSRLHLRHHLYTKHQIGTEEDKRKPCAPILNWKYRCQVVGCRRKFWGDQAEEKFKRHMTEQHGGVDGNLKKFKCEECGKEFAFRHQLVPHMLRHTNKETRPFKCETCGKGFVNRPNLRYHQLNTHKAPRLHNRKKETKKRDFVKVKDK